MRHLARVLVRVRVLPTTLRHCLLERPTHYPYPNTRPAEEAPQAIRHLTQGAEIGRVALQSADNAKTMRNLAPLGAIIIGP